jgi:gliding motility-associated-like protein
LYAVTVTNSCGLASDSVEFDLDFCDCPVYTPNAFTANGDEINDRFVPQFTCPNRSYLLRIYDRWGRIQWETTDPFKAWDGGGLPVGVYAWTIEYEPDSDVLRGNRTASGHVLLAR